MLDTYLTSLTSFVSRDSTTTQAQQVQQSPYGYTPTFAVCILFLTLFGVSSFVHLCQAIAYRKWFFLYTAVFAGLIELAGWSGRIWSSENVDNGNAFLIQIVCTIIAPTPLLAANFVILARIIRKLGDSYSRLGPRLYSRIFLSCDLVALVVQGGGGGIASGNNIPRAQLNLRKTFMRYWQEFVFQLIVMICYMTLATEYFWRFSRQRPVRRATEIEMRKPAVINDRLQLLIYALMFNTGCLFIRAIYRTIELADGFDGKVIQTQWLFNFFDATMVVFAMYTFNLAHPGRLLDEDDNSSFAEMESSSTELNISYPIDSYSNTKV
ncbi:RTA1-domain-containing protein [Gymnopus androsaceus JB14]|uniref:RTA1-domain-containing protein n=1 Tax=Gymnopus androsaceus JB14 TaxID=1447944 RepID=A0A6A4I2J5_9AGAR|nr:RTA1-domain-containing protein [Gymnopus androsaceus JB14]